MSSHPPSFESQTLLVGFCLELSEISSLRALGEATARLSWKLFQHEAFIISHVDPTEKGYISLYAEDTFEGEATPRAIPVEDHPTFPTNFDPDYKPKPFLINRQDPKEGPNWVPVGDATRRSMSIMVAPVLDGDRPMGEVMIHSYTKNRYTEEDLRLASQIGAFASGALRRLVAERDRSAMQQTLHISKQYESLGLLAGGIAHEFNNLLVGILGSAELAMMDVPESSPAMPSLLEIRTSAESAADLTRQLLAFSGRGQFVVERVDIPGTLRGMQRLLEAGLPSGIDLQFQITEEPLWIDTEVGQIRQLVFNLLRNAQEAVAEQGGRIRVSLGREAVGEAALRENVVANGARAGHYIVLTVADNGAGIDPVVLKRIFQPFYSTKKRGRGLGLSAVLGIVRSHKGFVLVESDPGEGSTFRVGLPLGSA